MGNANQWCAAPTRRKEGDEPGWRFLRPGSIVDVVCASVGPDGGCPVTPQEMENIKRFLEQAHLKPRFSKNIRMITGEETTTTESSDDSEAPIHSPTTDASISDLFVDLKNRQQGLREAFEAPDSDAVLVLTSGTGAPEAIAGLPTKVMTDRPKLFIGQGDITCAHCFVQEWWDWPTVYAPNIDTLMNFVRKNDPVADESRTELDFRRYGPMDELRRVEAVQIWTSVVMGHCSYIFLKGLLPLNDRADRWERGSELICRRIVGGELSSLSKGIGTYWELKCEEAILYITDDIGDPVQTLSCLIHLQQAGFLSHALAVIFGPFKGMAADAKPSRGLRDSSAVRRDIALALKDVPVFEYGDEINDYTPIPFNTDALLTCTADGISLTVPTGGRKFDALKQEPVREEPASWAWF